MTREIIQGLKFKKQPAGFDAFELAAVLEKAYLKQAREDKFTQKVTFSPSSIGYGNATCARYWKLAFDGADFVETTDAMGIAIMSNGTYGHQRIEQVFEDAGILVDKEVEIKLQDPPIRGYMDVVINWHGQQIVGEIKTTRQEAFFHRLWGNKPSTNNLFQILIYMKATNTPVGFLLYENKNTQEILILPIEMDVKNEALLEDALDWLRKVRKAWEDGEMPNRPFTKRNKICKDCPVFDTCWNPDAPEATIEIEAMKVPKL